MERTEQSQHLVIIFRPFVQCYVKAVSGKNNNPTAPCDMEVHLRMPVALFVIRAQRCFHSASWAVFVALFKATSRQSTGVLELAMRIKDTEMFGLYTPAANGTQVAALVLTQSNSKNLPRILDSGGKDF